jgi:hypothetical protein
MTNVADRFKTAAAEITRRLDAVEHVQNAKQSHVPIERTPGGGGVRMRSVDWATPVEPHETITLEMRDLEPLGPAFGRFYLRHEDREVRIDRELHPMALHDVLRPTQVIVHEIVMVPGKLEQLADRLVPSIDHRIERQYRATLVPAGTYEAEKARQERAEVARQPRRTSILSARPFGWPLGRDMLGWLEKQGIDLAIVDGRLTASTMRRPPILDLFRTAINDHSALIVGWLSDAPIACFRKGCEAEAATVLLGGASACEGHAE